MIDKPAFPRPVGKSEDEYGAPIMNHGQLGMTLREHYAGLAMKGFLSNKVVAEDWSTSQISDCSIEQADALIKALENNGK